MKLQRKNVWMFINGKEESKKGYTVCQGKKKANEQFGRKVKQDVSRNIKLFRNDVGMVNGEKAESCSRIKEGNRRLSRKRRNTMELEGL